MNGSSTSSPSGARQPGAAGRGIAAVREVLDELRAPSDRRSVVHPHRADVRAAVLDALAGQPANGYQIVRLLQERGAGTATPGAGAVYPILQLLADEGLATAAETDGRKVWTLTAAGHAAAESARLGPDPAGVPSSGDRGRERRGAIVRSGGQLAQAVALAAQSSTPGQVGEIVDALDDARRRILSILARS